MTWPDFWLGHRRENYTPVFNSFLESQINNSGVPLVLRVLAWVLRHSWGRHSDAVVDDEGARKVQVDCARDLKLLRKNKDGEWEPHRQKVNPVFQQLAKLQMLRLEGRGIFPVDPADPFAVSSPFVNPNRTNSEGKEKIPLHDWAESVYRVQHPEAYAEYQIVAEQYKKLRTNMVSAYKDWDWTAEKTSERGPTNEEDCPTGDGHDVREGSDTVSGRDPTSSGSSFKKTVNVSKGESSSSFSMKVRGALEPYGNIDDDVLDRFISECQKAAPDCTSDEIKHFVAVKAALLSRKIENPIGFLIVAVPKCLTGDSFRDFREKNEALRRWEVEQIERDLSLYEDVVLETPATAPSPQPAPSAEHIIALRTTIADLENWIAEHAGGNQIGLRLARRDLKKAESELAAALRKPVESEPSAKAQKVAQG